MRIRYVEKEISKLILLILNNETYLVFGL